MNGVDMAHTSQRPLKSPARSPLETTDCVSYSVSNTVRDFYPSLSKTVRQPIKTHERKRESDEISIPVDSDSRLVQVERRKTKKEMANRLRKEMAKNRRKETKKEMTSRLRNEMAKSDKLERLKEKNKWLKLPTDIFINILMRLSLVDCIRVKAVCLTWRTDVIKMVACNSHTPSHQVAMIIPTKDRKTLIYRVLNLPDNNVYRLHLPAWSSPAICLGSSDGWLILMDKYTKGCFLLNLSSNEQIQLPSRAKVCNSGKYQDVYDFLKHGTGLNAKAILSFHPTSREYMVVIACLENTLAFYKEGNPSWTVRESDEYRCITDMKFYKNRLHIVKYSTELIIYELGPHPNLAESKILLGPELEYPCGAGSFDVAQVFLVQSCEELLMVIRMYHWLPECRLECRQYDRFRSTFRIFKMDTAGSCWIKVESLGDRMLFLGYPKSILVTASSDDGYKGNCIYFANANAGDDSGVFHLEDGSIETFPPSISYQIPSQPENLV